MAKIALNQVLQNGGSSPQVDVSTCNLGRSLDLKVLYIPWFIHEPAFPRGRHLDWVVLKIQSQASPWSHPKHVSASLSSQPNGKNFWKTYKPMASPTPPHQYSWCISSNNFRVHTIIYSPWWGRLWFSMFGNTIEKQYWHEQKRARGSRLVFPQNPAVQINAYTNHRMQRTFRANFPFPYCRTASLWGRRSLHLQMHFCGPQLSTLTIWEVWFHMTNKACPHFPNFAVLQNKNVFSWELLPLCKELASCWLAVVFRIRRCFLCNHTLWLHLTDVCCLNCPFIHGSTLKEGHRLTHSVSAGFRLSSLLWEAEADRQQQQAIRTSKPWILETSLLSWTLFTKLRRSTKGNETQWHYQSPIPLEDLSNQCVHRAPAQCMYSTAMTENSEGSETFITGLLPWLSRCLHSYSRKRGLE